MQHVDQLLVYIRHEVHLAQYAGAVSRQIHNGHVLYKFVVCCVLNQRPVVPEIHYDSRGIANTLWDGRIKSGAGRSVIAPCRC